MGFLVFHRSGPCKSSRSNRLRASPLKTYEANPSFRATIRVTVCTESDQRCLGYLRSLAPVLRMFSTAYRTRSPTFKIFKDFDTLAPVSGSVLPGCLRTRLLPAFIIAFIILALFAPVIFFKSFGLWGARASVRGVLLYEETMLRTIGHHFACRLFGRGFSPSAVSF